MIAQSGTRHHCSQARALCIRYRMQTQIIQTLRTNCRWQRHGLALERILNFVTRPNLSPSVFRRLFRTSHLSGECIAQRIRSPNSSVNPPQMLAFARQVDHDQELSPGLRDSQSSSSCMTGFACFCENAQNTASISDRWFFPPEQMCYDAPASLGNRPMRLNDERNRFLKNGVVYIVDDDPAVRQSIEMMVRVMGLRPVTFDSAEEFLQSGPEQVDGCLIADVRMLGMSGMQLLTEVANRRWNLPSIIITAYADVRIAVQSIRAGAITLLEKPYRDQELWDAIVEAMALSNAAYQTNYLRRTVQDGLATLTAEEHQVLQQMVQGTANKLISQLLDISPRTVDIRRQSILKKMAAENPIHLIRLLGQSGISIEHPISGFVANE